MGFLSYASTLLVLLQAHGVISDYLVPTYPAPVDLTSNSSAIAKSWKALTPLLDSYTSNKTVNGSDPALNGVGNITISVGLFSLHDPDAIQLQYHHTSPETKAAKNGGTTDVDADSIYRVASISKLITVLAGMVELSDEDWARPLSDVMPGFIDDSKRRAAEKDPIRNVQWDKVSLWSLASQLSGIPTVGLPVGDQYRPGTEQVAGAPVVDIAKYSPCAVRLLKNINNPNQYCSSNETVETIADQPGNFLPWSTPVYSDLNFMLLGIAISNITGKSITEMYHSTVFEPLGMSSSMDVHPIDKENVDRSVIVGKPEVNWEIEGAITTPSGGLLSNICDLQKLGLGILGNKLLPANVTRKWMKPVSHTSSLSYSIGAPWEIHRYVNPKTNKTCDLYTKLGDSGFYGGVVVLIPEFDVGFAMLNAGTDTARATKASIVADYVTNAIMPALEAQAVKEAQHNFAGTYNASGGDVDASITISHKPATPGGVHSDLVVSKWTYNGTNVLKGTLFKALEGVPLRLEQSIPNHNGEVAFQLSFASQRMTYTEAMTTPDSGVVGTFSGFYSTNGDFAFTDSLRWGGFPATTFAFKVDDKGRATACSPLADKIDLERVE